MPEYKTLKLTDIWRTCNKIRAAIFRSGLNLWDYYKPLDPKENGLISESEFGSILSGPLKIPIGLSEQEIIELTDYFRANDGRILYSQFCNLIHNSVPDLSKNERLVTGLEWEKPFQVNRLSFSEERRLKILLAKIATLVNLRRLVLRPYFQDYELIAKNVGCVTFCHFGRVLHFLNIDLSDDDFRLLIKKFAKDSYTINYVAFISALDFIIKHFDEKCMFDLGGDLLLQFPGRALSAELPKLPRPEIGKIRPTDLGGYQNTFHPVMASPPEKEDLETVMRRIQRHVFNNRVRTSECFQEWDKLNTGRITVGQFRRGLDRLGLSGLQRLRFSEAELKMLFYRYKDPNDPDLVLWQVFEDDVDQVFTIKELEKSPDLIVKSPPNEIKNIQPKGVANWQEVDPGVRDFCEDTLDRLKHRAKALGILFKPAFSCYDSLNRGHVSRTQFRQALSTCGILCSPEEINSLELRYVDDMGFNYFKFIKEIHNRKIEEPLYESFSSARKALNGPKLEKEPSDRESNIIEILAKIKRQVVRERLRVIEFFQQFDINNEMLITRPDFERGLGSLRLQLTKHEIKTLEDVFKSPGRPCMVEYTRFSNTIEEAWSQSCLERAPLLVPLQHLPSDDDHRNFLDYDERHIVSMALDKLAKFDDRNFDSLFQDFDKRRCGTITREQFIKALSVRGIHHLISAREIELVVKCFGKERGLRMEFDYRSFLKACEIIFKNSKQTPF